MSQYPCDFSNLAPSGCTQYIFGEPEGDIQASFIFCQICFFEICNLCYFLPFLFSQSYNFKGNDHLASQNQKICIRCRQLFFFEKIHIMKLLFNHCFLRNCRREAGNCRICYTIDQPNDFQVRERAQEKGILIFIFQTIICFRSIQLSGDDEEGVAIKGTESACCGHVIQMIY